MDPLALLREAAERFPPAAPRRHALLLDALGGGLELVLVDSPGVFEAFLLTEDDLAKPPGVVLDEVAELRAARDLTKEGAAPCSATT